MTDILDILLQFGSLAGVAALVTALVNVLKQFGVVKDGDAGKWVAGFNLAALAVLVALKFFMPLVGMPEADAWAAQLAQILMIVLGYVIQLGVGRAVHTSLATLRLPLIGFSYTEADLL